MLISPARVCSLNLRFGHKGDSFNPPLKEFLINVAVLFFLEIPGEPGGSVCVCRYVREGEREKERQSERVEEAHARQWVLNK